jgi:hypothetical protein
VNADLRTRISLSTINLTWQAMTMYILICENLRNDFIFNNWVKYFTKIGTAKKYVDHIRKGETEWYDQVSGSIVTDIKTGLRYRIGKIVPESETFEETKPVESIGTTTLPPGDDFDKE